MNRARLAIIIIFTCLCPAWAEYPTLVLGVDAAPVLLPGSTMPADFFWAMEAEGVFSLRTMLSEQAYLALLIKGRGGALLIDPLTWLDEELLSAETGLTTGPGKVTLKALLHSSFSGTLSENAFHTPEWETTYHFSTERQTINPFVSYSGLVRLRPADGTDVFSEKMLLGFDYRPSFLEEYRLSLTAGWDLWYESLLADAGGGVTTSLRHDFYGILTGKAGGIVDYFLNWDIALAVTLLFSTANAYLTLPGLLNERSEDSFVAELRAGIDWSPSTSLSVGLKAKFAWKPFFERLAVNAAGAILDERVFVVSSGGEFSLVWSPVDRLHFIIRAQAERAFSNEAALSDWLVRGSVGVKVNIDPSLSGE